MEFVRLNPKVDRLTLSCEMEIDSDGEVVNHEIFQSVIKTTERMTYSDVNKILVDQDEELHETIRTACSNVSTDGRISSKLFVKNE